MKFDFRKQSKRRLSQTMTRRRSLIPPLNNNLDNGSVPPSTINGRSVGLGTIRQAHKNIYKFSVAVHAACERIFLKLFL
jgi:hypothetical protein